MDNATLFHNLIRLAAIDGRFTEDEIQALAERAEQWGLASDEFETGLAGLAEGRIHLELPADRPSRLRLLGEMIRLMAVDGELAELEMRLCATAAVAMDISTDQLDDLIDELVERKRRGG